MTTKNDVPDSRSDRRPRLGMFGLAFAIAGCLSPDEPGNLVPKTVDDDPSLPFVELDGTKLHAETFGDPSAPVIIALHRGPGVDYRSMLKLRDAVDGVRLEDRHYLVFWDQRGSGLSRRHASSEVNGATYMRDLEAVVDHYSPGRPVVLLAQSWGGMYGTHYISLHPERVAGAVLMEPGPLTGALFEEAKSGIRELDFGSEWLNDLAWAQTIVSPDGHARADYALAQGMLTDSQPRYHGSTTDRQPLWRLGAVAFTNIQSEGMQDGKGVWDFTFGLDKYTRPVLFMASERNEILGIDFQKRQMAKYPNAELAVVANAGHDFVWTAAEATLRPIHAYLAKIGF